MSDHDHTVYYHVSERPKPTFPGTTLTLEQIGTMDSNDILDVLARDGYYWTHAMSLDRNGIRMRKGTNWDQDIWGTGDTYAQAIRKMARMAVENTP